MSEASAAPKSATARAVQAAALIVVFAVVFIASRLVHQAASVVGTIVGLGFLLLAGTLTSELMEVFGLPHLSGYLLAGLIAGPSVLGLIDAGTLTRLAPVNALALSLIALAGGAELEIGMLKASAKSIAWATLLQHTIVLVITAAVFAALVPFTALSTLETGAIVGAALLWGLISVTRSPAALLGIIAQVRPAGPLTTFSIAFVMLSNLVCVLLTAVLIPLVRPLFDSAEALSFSDLTQLGFDMLGSVSVGVCLGLGLIVYLRLIGKNRLLMLLGLGVGLSELLRYIRFDALLAFLVAGFFVRNFSQQGPRLLEAVQRTGAVVFVVFFALAGAKVDLSLLRSVGLVALALCLVRFLATYGAARLSSRTAKDRAVIHAWGWSPLVSQAGLSLGIIVVVTRAFPGIGAEFTTLSIACVTINEIVGPILFKLGLDRAGESGKAAEEGSGATSTPTPTSDA